MQDSVQRSLTQEVIVQLTPQDTQHLIGFLGTIANTVTRFGDGGWPRDIDRENARRLMYYLKTVYEVNGYIGSRRDETT